MDDTEKEKEVARFTITTRMGGFLMIFAGVAVVPLAQHQHRWQSYVACVFLAAIAVCSAGMIKGRSAFVWLAVALWFVSSGFAAFWLWGTDLALLLVFPGLPVPLDMIVEFLPATKTLAPPSTS